MSSPSRPSELLPSSLRDEVVRESDPLERGPERELAGMEDEGLVAGDLDQLGQLRLLLARVDDGRAVVAEDAEAVAEVEIDARGLDRFRHEGIDDDPAGIDLGPDIPVGQDHARPILLAPHSAAPRMSRSTSRWRVSMSS